MLHLICLQAFWEIFMAEAATYKSFRKWCVSRMSCSADNVAAFPTWAPLLFTYYPPMSEQPILLQCCMSAASSAPVLCYHFHLSGASSWNRRLFLMVSDTGCIRHILVCFQTSYLTSVYIIFSIPSGPLCWFTPRIRRPSARRSWNVVPSIVLQCVVIILMYCLLFWRQAIWVNDEGGSQLILCSCGSLGSATYVRYFHVFHLLLICM